MKKLAKALRIIILRFVAAILIIISVSGVVMTFYEDEKQELYSEMFEYFSTYMRIEREMLQEEIGIIEIKDPKPISYI